jgi:hypothetical protein
VKEIAEFRVSEEFVSLLFNETEGTKLGTSIRKIELERNDPRYAEVGKLDQQLARQGKSFFFGWNIRRSYRPAEFESAELFHLQISAAFEPAGEECGTVYDESDACSFCGAGRRQVSDLVLDLRKVPKRLDIARTIADEWIISERLAGLLRDAGVTGIDLRTVRHKGFYKDDSIDLSKYPSGRKLVEEAAAAGIFYPSGKFDVWLNQQDHQPLLDGAWGEHAEAMEALQARRGKPLPVWYQLIVASTPVLLTTATRFGIDPFNEDEDGKYRCPHAHVRGLNLLSEVSLKRGSWDRSDFAITDGLVGMKQGLLRPRPLLLISQRVRNLLEEHKLKGYRLEVAHLS